MIKGRSVTVNGRLAAPVCSDILVLEVRRPQPTTTRHSRTEGDSAAEVAR
jgi:hypothetical protein